MSPRVTRPSRKVCLTTVLLLLLRDLRPRAEEAAFNESANFVWPDLNFGRLRSGGGGKRYM